MNLTRLNRFLGASLRAKCKTDDVLKPLAGDMLKQTGDMLKHLELSEFRGYLKRRRTGNMLKKVKGEILEQFTGHVMKQLAGDVLNQLMGNLLNQLEWHIEAVDG